MASNDSETTSGGTGARGTARMPGACAGGIRAVDRPHHLPRAGADRACGTCPPSFLPKVYFDAVTDAGGIAVLLPPQPASREIAPHGRVGGLDGLIVAGGADVDPARYGQPPHPRTDAPRTDRDAWEDALLTAAIAIELPFLGICRGVQVLNVALGGTLHQHLPDVVGTERYQPSPAVFGDGEVTIEPDTRLAALCSAQAPAPPPRRCRALATTTRPSTRSPTGSS